VLTRAAGAFMRALHTREPVILPAERYDAWLDEGNANWWRVLEGVEASLLQEYAVTGYLNRRGAEGPECITPTA
jgi:putative SOS response-associated peptidase YedK